MRVLYSFFVFLFLTVNVEAAENATYNNSELGFSITKPSSWIFAEPKTNELVENAQFDDKALTEEFKKYAKAPIAVISKYAEPYNGYNPSVSINVRPLQNFKADAPVDILVMSTYMIGHNNKNFGFIKKPAEVVVDGVKAAYTSFELKTVISGKEIITYSQMWAIPKNNYFLRITATSEQNDNVSKKEIADIISTIKITK